MNRFLSLTAMLVALSVTLHAEGLFEYNGLFPSDRPAEAAISNYMLIDKPRQIEFEVIDRQGKPCQTVKVVEIVLTSDTSIQKKSDAGLKTVDLPEPGIYEVKVRPSADAPGEIGFTLRVKDTGKSPQVTDTASSTQAPVPAPQALQQATAPSETYLPLPVATQTPIEPPSVSVPAAVGPVPADSTGPVMLMPSGNGYADPFKPIELRFGADIPEGTPLEACMQVFVLDAKGVEQTAQGQCFPAGTRGVRFIPAGLINGAVYHVRAIDPQSRRRLADFSFPTFPEVRLTMARGDAGDVRLEITWSPLSGLMPSAEGQVIRLDMTELAVQSSAGDIITFAMKPDLPPFGNVNGIEYRAQPWRFTMTIPPEHLQGATQLMASLRVPLAGSEKPVDVVKSTLAFAGPTQTAAFGSSVQPVIPETPIVASASAGDPPVASLPEVDIATLTGPADQAAQASPAIDVPAPAAASQAFESTLPAPEVLSIPPVVPCEDPGASATLTILKKFVVGEGGPNDAFSWPKGMTWAEDGTLWVVDSQNRRLLRFIDDGRLITALGKKGKGPGMLGLPIDISVATSGIVVSDTAAHTVHLFDADGTFIRAIGTWGTKTGQLDLPHGVFIDGDQVWVTDRGNTKILRFGLDGVYRGGFGKKGELDGYITEPVSVRIANDIVWVLEGKNGRVQKFSRDGKALGSFPTSSKDPVALEIDPWGYIWVADGEGHRIMRFDQAGRLLLRIQPPAGGRQWIPTSVAVRRDGMIAVGDGEDRSVHLYRLTKP
ncbi:MAG TPA: 6-bladed beta-propeller [Candidatus Ozemobacteraceae bacterium]|nr:6-bladed beta-propeller [Candidatus Ozemobacteraceae bacterium]